MKFMLEVDLDQVGGEPAEELSRILHYWAQNLKLYAFEENNGETVYDAEYNPVGSWALVEPDADEVPRTHLDRGGEQAREQGAGRGGEHALGHGGHDAGHGGHAGHDGHTAEQDHGHRGHAAEHDAGHGGHTAGHDAGHR